MAVSARVKVLGPCLSGTKAQLLLPRKLKRGQPFGAQDQAVLRRWGRLLCALHSHSQSPNRAVAHSSGHPLPSRWTALLPKPSHQSFSCPRALGPGMASEDREGGAGLPHLLDVPDPVPDVVEGLLVGDVIDQHDTLCEIVDSVRDRSSFPGTEDNSSTSPWGHLPATHPFPPFHVGPAASWSCPACHPCPAHRVPGPCYHRPFCPIPNSSTSSCSSKSLPCTPGRLMLSEAPGVKPPQG